MYTSLYFYRVPKDKIDQFIEIQKESANIYRQFGAIDDLTFCQQNLSGKYGCTPIRTELSIEPDEVLFFSLSIFSSKEDHDRVMALVDRDPKIGSLYAQIVKTIDVSKVLTGEFSRMV